MDAEPESPGDREVVDVRGAQGVLAGEFGIQVNVYHGTWTEATAPGPLANESGKVASPYRGLRPFEPWDERFFFGRDDAASAVLERLAGTGLLVVSGASGAGKSSLVRAGVLPRIAGGGLATPGSAHWPRLVITPTASPLDELAERVAPVARLDAAAVRSDLTEDPASFARAARQAASARAPGPARKSSRLLLVVDQFEQLFTRCADEGQRRAFIGAVCGAANEETDPDPAAVVLVVVRADFEARCAEYPELAAAVQDRYLVTSMTEQQLRLAITEPARQAGSHVEDELTEALLREMRDPTALDARDGRGAGALPLLSHALDQAWRERTGPALTLADYERTGGVEGAIAESAQRAYQRLTPDQRRAAQRVFTRLVTTSDDGTDAADRVARAELTAGADAADVERVLETFAEARLLTLAAGTVEISHEALLSAWPLLRDTWLEEIHTDRMVRARLHLAADEWNRLGRDRSYLYHGAVLDTATRTVDRTRADPRHPPLAPVESDFLRASAQARRRRIRTRRLVTAALAALALAAATLSAVAIHGGNRVEAQLRSANAATLGQEAQDRAPTDIATAAQLALAAWRSDPRSPQARTALVNAYLAMPTLDAELAGVATAPIKEVWVRGDTALLPGHPLTVITGITGPTPQRWEVPNLPTGLPAGDLSPDGRWFAYLAPDGTLRIRDVVARSDPVTVATGQRSDYVRFAPDGKRLGWLTDSGRPGFVDLWTCALADCATRPPQHRELAAPGGIDGFWLTPDPDHLLVRYGDPNLDGTRLVLRSATDGAELATMAPDAAVVRGGAAVVSCEPPPGGEALARATFVVTRLDSPAPPTRLTSAGSTCGADMGISTDGNWLVERTSGQSHPRLQLTELDGGLSRQVSVPTWSTTYRIGPVADLGVSTSAGQPVVLFGHGTSLLRLRTDPAPVEPDPQPERSLADDGRYLIRFADPSTSGAAGIGIEDRATGRRVASFPGLPSTAGGMLDGNSLWVGYPANGRVQVDRYEVSPPHKVATFVPPAPEQREPSFGMTLVDEPSRKMILAVSGGVLSALDPTTGRALAAPVTLGPPKEFALLSNGVELTPRPRHPGQLAVSGDHAVTVWDALTGHQLASIPVRGTSSMRMAFDPSGDRIAVLPGNGTIELWDVESAAPARRPIPAADAGMIVGFDADGYLDEVLTGSPTRLAFIDMSTGQEAGSTEMTRTVTRLVVGDSVAPLDGTDEELPYELPLTARAWHDALCAAANRPFTADERGLLPPGADDTPPC